MEKYVRVFSIISFLVLMTYASLIVFQFLSPIVHFRYIVPLVSFSISLNAIALLLKGGKGQFLRWGIGLILIVPFILSTFAFFNTSLFFELFNVLIGGTIFQIGTSIYVLLGGFANLTKIRKRLHILNYLGFILLSILCILNIDFFESTPLYIYTGLVLTVFSIILMITNRFKLYEAASYE